ncbi:MAG: amino acid adenylation domain-containing protein, partial [Candidatus Aminicenantes bacterium]|nr:amino acid adenylation domain-containing protein [Candidatus Aminicenantes bacterium]
RLMAISRGSDHALHVVLAAALMALLGRYTGMEDITVATPVYRQAGEGQYINTVLALRTRLHPGITFKELLGRVKQTLGEAIEHQAYPVELLPELLEIPVSEGVFPLFDTALTLENIHPWEYIEYMDLGMVFRFTRTSQDIHGIAVYDSLLYQKSTIEQVVAHFNRLGENALAGPDAAISTIEILSEAEKNRLLIDFNNTQADYPKDKTIHRLFEEQAERMPDHMAVVGAALSVRPLGPVGLSYRELNEQSNRLAHLLIEKGVLADNIIGIMLERSNEMIIGILGILKSGGAYLPIDPEYPRERIDYMLKDSGAKIMIGRAEFNFSCFFVTSSLPCFLASYSSNLAYVIYTSGTTGKPKGMMIEHRNVVRLLFNDKFLFDFSGRDTWTMFHSYCFDFSVWEMYGALLYGGKLVIVPKMATRDFKRYLEILKESQVTILNQTPSVFYNLMSIELENPRQELNIRYVIFGGEMLSPSRLKSWHAKYPTAKIINMYGITETTVHVTFKEISGKEIGSDASNIGRPIPTLTTYIMDKHLRLLPTGVPGELVVGGDGVGRGYLNRLELTGENFVENPYRYGERIYRSGDLAKLTGDGDLVYLGRIDRQVKIRGFRIETAEIEHQLVRHEDIKEAVVMANEDKNGDKYLCAYIVPQSSAVTSLTGPGLIDYLESKLPAYMIPSYFVQLDRIPLTASGKVDGKALPATGPGTGVAYIAPRDEAEERLTEIWSEVLGIPKNKISIDDNFFHLGGHSLKLIMLAFRIHKVFDVTAPISKFFEISTVRALAQYVKTAAQDKYTDIEPVEKRDYYPMSSAQKRLYVMQAATPGSINYNMPLFTILEGPLEKIKLENIFRELIRRHESLRTSFHLVNSNPVQKIHGDVEFEVVYKKLSTDYKDYTDKKNNILHFIRPFDLSHAPMVRVGLIKTKEKEHILMVDMHHIISDGISHQVLLKEFLKLFKGDTLPGLRLQYKDFSQWQNNMVLSGRIKKQEEYWLNAFKGDLPVLKMPTDYPRPVSRDFKGSDINFDIDSADAEALRNLAVKEDATLFMVMLTICAVFLFKLSGQEDIIVGTPVAGRRHADLGNIIGVFINTLALRNYPSGSKRFIDFLRKVKQQTLEAFDNQEYQFEDLVGQVLKERDTGRNPLFDIMFGFGSQEMNPAPEQEEENPAVEIKLKPYNTEYNDSKFDLLISGTAKGDRFSFSMQYSTQLFKTETILRFSQYFKEIIAAVMEDENMLLKDIPLSTNLASAETRLFQDDGSDFGF